MNEEERVQIRDARKRCFFIVDNVIIDHYASIIGPFPTLVYGALCRHADYSTRETHPSHDFLAKELAISRATVKRSINMLIQHRLIGRKHRKSKSGDPDTNIYIILEPWGGVSQTLPNKDAMLSEGNMNEEVGSVGTVVGSIRPEVGSDGTEGGVSQNPGVGSVRATNNTQLEQDSSNKKDTSSSPHGDGHETDTSPDSPGTQPLTDAPITIDEIVDGWNEICVSEGMPRKTEVGRQNASFRKNVKRSILAHPDRDFWQRVLNNAWRTPWSNGSATGWKATLHWVVENEVHLIKIYEAMP